MEAVILIGIQGSGKSTFFKEGFFDTHVRINLDMLRTRHRERTWCLHHRSGIGIGVTPRCPRGSGKWKHAMHLILLLLSGIQVVREAFVPVVV